jgi:hypothetical protein
MEIAALHKCIPKEGPPRRDGSSRAFLQSGQQSWHLSGVRETAVLREGFGRRLPERECAGGSFTRSTYQGILTSSFVASAWWFLSMGASGMDARAATGDRNPGGATGTGRLLITVVGTGRSDQDSERPDTP